jgi:Protein of unknown function (DUF3810)
LFTKAIDVSCSERSFAEAAWARTSVLECESQVLASVTLARVQLGVVVLAVALAVVPLPPSFVERQFSTRLFPATQSALTWFSNLIPFALFDALMLTLAGWWTWRLVRDVSGRPPGHTHDWIRVGRRLLSRTVTTAAILYLLFLLTWGLNYRRRPLADRLALNPEGPTPAAAESIVLRAVSELNALYNEAHASESGNAMVVGGSLSDAFRRAQSLLAAGWEARPARPKWSLLDPYFRSAAVSGMTDPFFLETLVASDLLTVERPFVMAHEWSHLAGFANEGEANFLGWLTCIRGAELDRYSGWLFLYSEALPGLSRPARNDAASRLGAGPRDDLRAISDRLRRNVRPRVADVGWQVYDKYLKANRIEAGAASYREVVRLVLSARFDEQWVPTLK